MTDDSSELQTLLLKARDGDTNARNVIFSRYQQRLLMMVELRLDRRLRARIDPSDVVQEAFLDALRTLDDYLAAPRAPWFLWLRYLVSMRLKALHRHHFGVSKRDARLDVSIYHGPLPAADSVALAERLMGNLTTPSEAAVRAERTLLLHEALLAMDPLDREVLALRHFELLTRREVARELGIEEEAAGKRYLRAVKRLGKLLDKKLSSEG